MVVMHMNNDFRLIIERIQVNFKRQFQTEYWLQIVNDPYDQTFNFFINIRPRGKRIHSIPLHTIDNYNLSYLERLVARIMEKFQLSITYDGFVGLKWPIKQEYIQKRRHKDE